MENQINENESLKIISEMIESAKDRFKEDGFFYLLWGWLVFAAAITHYILMEFVHWPYAWSAWPVLMFLGGLVSMIVGFRKAAAARHKSMFDLMMISLWSAFLIALFMILAFTALGKINPLTAYPLIIIIYGVGVWVSGGVLKYKPLILGGIACWIIAGIAFYQPFNMQLLLLALSIVIAYIIPGHMLRQKALKDV